MAEIIIKKRVSLEFLGDEYKEGYLVLSSIPVSESDILDKKIESVDGDNVKAIKVLTELVTERFIEGKFPSSDGTLQDLNKEDLAQFPIEVYTEVIQQLQGKVSPN